MHQFFKLDAHKQQIFLLYGLGGAGKTQTTLKFINESGSRFSDVFLIDTSTLATIDKSLKNIAETRAAGTTAQDALDWLGSTSAEWLLLFDNADNPEIKLNQFFPKCKHGNIIITSRNHGLLGFADSSARLSNMEQLDAMELLLKCAGEAGTPGNQKIAAEIVKALCFFPLAIIQAGAFILESGSMDIYLKLFTTNSARLLQEEPAQPHDGYENTVYTTWKISFDRLSKCAATLLQLFSFLHYQGISEELFSRASQYEPDLRFDPPKEEVQEPLHFLSQFLGPTGEWDSFLFLKVMKEIQAYSLIHFNLEQKTYSIHPLVHKWVR
ncbi:P-loop containing nucleoside triphosphate hydrolase protein, partial [Mycena leptocephala]